MTIKRLIGQMALVGVLWVGLGVCFSWATPPNEIKLSYDSALKVLHVNAEHPSDRLERHYLRTLVVTQNGSQVKVVTLPRQTLARGLSVDVDLPAQGDDLISVELFCSQGGHGAGEIKLPPDDVIQAPEEVVAHQDENEPVVDSKIKSY